jgi:O-antigen ligase
MSEEARTSASADRFAEVLWIAVLAIVAVTPLVFSTTTKDVYRLPKALFFQSAVLVLGAAILVWDATREGLARRFRPHRVSLLLAAMAVAWTAVVTMTAVKAAPASHAPLTVFCYALFFSAALLFGRRTPRAALAAMFVPAVVISVIMVLQWRDVWTPVALPERPVGRFAHIGLQGNPDPVGAYLIVPAIAAVAATIAFRRGRIVLVPTTLLLLVGVLLTESVTALVAVAAALLAFLVVVPSKKARMITAFVTVAAAIVVLAYPPTRGRATALARSAAEGNYQELTSFRLPAWDVAWRMFLERPVTGVGPGGFAARYMSYKLAGDELHPEWLTLGNENFGETHNDHLQLLAEGGLPAFVLFAIVAVRVALLSFRVPADSDERRFVKLFALPGVVAFAVTAMAQFPMQLTEASAVAIFGAALCHVWGAGAVD